MRHTAAEELRMATRMHLSSNAAQLPQHKVSSFSPMSSEPGTTSAQGLVVLLDVQRAKHHAIRAPQCSGPQPVLDCNHERMMPPAAASSTAEL